MTKVYNNHLPSLPEHLLQYVVDQDYKHYTPIDQAVWRYVMTQNVNYLPDVCYGSYLEGLEKTGLSIDSIPSMYGMNRILKDIGWYAVAVDGFIPPSVFMEFQANNVLVIAADIRQINHIGYTPAPDILHEAAGHAPIIADRKYADYLKKFGEIGAKAFSSHHDFEIFEAIRHLSILKESPSTKLDVIKQAEDKVLKLQSSSKELSEMSKIRNLHWWTVEYGLIASLDKPKIYGAGLLSSISESVNCLSDHVIKKQYNINASNVTFDITNEQPQLFVADSFDHLNEVLDQFSESMAFKTGGDYGINLAIESKQISTCQYDSGVQVSGIFKSATKVGGQIVYLKTEGPTALSYSNKEIKGHGISHHYEGFGCPVGMIANYNISDFSHSMVGKNITVKYINGVLIEGQLVSIIKNTIGENMILSFEKCTVSVSLDSKSQEILFDPSWGKFDLVLGSTITSSFPQPADYSSFPLEKVSLNSYNIHHDPSIHIIELNDLYLEIREMRNSTIDDSRLSVILNILRDDFPDDWLLSLEICELVKSNYPNIYAEGYDYLQQISASHPDYKKLIFDGLNIL